MNTEREREQRPQGLPEIEVIGMLESSGHDHSRRVHDPEGISPTATAVAGGTHHIKIFDHTKYRVRKLTPTEYGRLQAFPMDNWKQVVSNSQAYKQFGNAVTVTLAEGIGKSVIGYLDSVLGVQQFEKRFYHTWKGSYAFCRSAAKRGLWFRGSKTRRCGYGLSKVLAWYMVFLYPQK